MSSALDALRAGFADGRVVPRDWGIPGAGAPALEVAWYLCHDTRRTQATHEETLGRTGAAA